MRTVLALAAALGAGAGAAVLVGAFPQAVRRRRGMAVDLPIVASALAALLTRSAPTGTPAIDLALGAGFAALASWGATRAPHRGLAVVAVAATATLGFSPLAAAGGGVAVAVVLLRARLPPLKGLAGGLVGVGVLSEIGSSGPSWREAIAALGVIGLAWVAARRSSDSARRTFALGISAALAFVMVAAAGFLLFAVPAARDLERAVRLSEGATEILTAARGNDASSSLALAANAFGQAERRLGRWPARLVEAVPGAAQNAVALRTLAGAGREVAASAAAVTTGPADLRLAQGGIDLAAVEAAGRGVATARVAVRDALRDLRATRSRSLLPPVAEASQELHQKLTDASPTLAILERALSQLPPMLGRDAPRRYLLALQTPAESRAAGGIIGAFGVLEADQGRLVLTRTGNAPELNRAGAPEARQIAGADEFMSRYGRFLPLQNWQNLSMSPDWPTVAFVAQQLFPQSGGQPVDGVIGLDPFALSAILAATGPIEVPPWPLPISAENAKSVLLHEQYLFFPNPERREFVADVTAAAFARLTGEGVSLRALSASLAEAARHRNLQLWAADADAQELIDDVAASGGFPYPDESTDLLSVVTQNSSGNKIDWFLHRATSYDLTFDPALGRIGGRIKIDLRNDAPAAGLPDYVIGSAGPRGTRTSPGENRTWVSVYTPLELNGALLNGQPLTMEAEGELGFRVYSAFVTVPPQASVSIELDVAGPIDPERSSYRLHLRSQVLPNPERVKVAARFADGWKATGPTEREFELHGDRRLVFGFKRSDE